VSAPKDLLFAPHTASSRALSAQVRELPLVCPRTVTWTPWLLESPVRCDDTMIVPHGLLVGMEANQ
jgi:hypothetical protein